MRSEDDSSHPANALPKHPSEMTDEEILAEARTLLGEMPAWIQDPIGRGEEDVIWSPTPDRPSAHDLMRLSPEDFAKFRRIADLSEYLLGPEPPSDPAR